MPIKCPRFMNTSLKALLEGAANNSCVELSGEYIVDQPIVVTNKSLHLRACGCVTIKQAFDPAQEKPIIGFYDSGDTRLTGRFKFYGLDTPALYDSLYPLTGPAKNNNNYSALEFRNSPSICVDNVYVEGKITGITLDKCPESTVGKVEGLGFADQLTSLSNWHILIRDTNSENVSQYRITSDNFGSTVLCGAYSYKYFDSVPTKIKYLDSITAKRIGDHGVYITSGSRNVILDGYHFSDCKSSTVRVDETGATVKNGYVEDSNVGVSVRADCVTVHSLKCDRSREAVRGSPNLQTGARPSNCDVDRVTLEDGVTAAVMGFFEKSSLSNICVRSGSCFGVFLRGGYGVNLQNLQGENTNRILLLARGVRNLSARNVKAYSASSAYLGHNAYAVLDNVDQGTFHDFYSDAGGVREISTSSDNLFYDLDSGVPDLIQGSAPRML